jgi:pimeloyl-ACP methyl ester carboxylesterase
MARSVVRYATTADGLEIVYQVLGDGPIDRVIVPGLTSNVDRNADYPRYGAHLRRFARFARTIVLDRLGGGISDREVGSGSAEDRMDDVRAVMDAIGCRWAALLGHVEGGAIAILFAATYPDRASALVGRGARSGRRRPASGRNRVSRGRPGGRSPQPGADRGSAALRQITSSATR